MKILHIAITTLFLLISGIAPSFALTAAPTKPSAKSWVVYYNDEIPYQRFIGYDIIAFDSDSYPNFSQRRPGQVILGYLSTSEAETYRDYYGQIEKLGVLLGSSELWKEHRIIDIRKSEWRKYFINKLVPDVLKKGFDGIMLDTIDSAIYLEEENPKKYKGMKAAALQFMIELRQTYPHIKLMLNRGFEIAEQAAPYLDYILAESIRVEHDFDNNTDMLFPKSTYNEYVRILHAAQRKNPKLEVVTLDYWKMKSVYARKIRLIYEEQRKNGFIPYVSTPDLMKFHPEP